MSADTNQLGSIRYVVDHDCGNYRLGEVDGGFNTNELKRYLRDYGEEGYSELCQQMIHMSAQLAHLMARVRMSSDPFKTAKNMNKNATPSGVKSITKKEL